MEHGIGKLVQSTIHLLHSISWRIVVSILLRFTFSIYFTEEPGHLSTCTLATKRHNILSLMHLQDSCLPKRQPALEHNLRLFLTYSEISALSLEMSSRHVPSTSISSSRVFNSPAAGTRKLFSTAHFKNYPLLHSWFSFYPFSSYSFFPFYLVST